MRKPKVGDKIIILEWYSGGGSLDDRFNDKVFTMCFFEAHPLLAVATPNFIKLS